MQCQQHNLQHHAAAPFSRTVQQHSNQLPLMIISCCRAPQEVLDAVEGGVEAQEEVCLHSPACMSSCLHRSFSWSKGCCFPAWSLRDQAAVSQSLAFCLVCWPFLLCSPFCLLSFLLFCFLLVILAFLPFFGAFHVSCFLSSVLFPFFLSILLSCFRFEPSQCNLYWLGIP